MGKRAEIFSVERDTISFYTLCAQKRERTYSRLWCSISAKGYSFAGFLVVLVVLRAGFLTGSASAGVSSTGAAACVIVGAIAASRFTRRDFRRAALFLWRMPFWAALSNMLMASNTAAFEGSRLLVSKAARVFLIAVRAAPR